MTAIGTRRASKAIASNRSPGLAAAVITAAARRAAARRSRPGSSWRSSAIARARRCRCSPPLAKRDTEARSQGSVPGGPPGPAPATSNRLSARTARTSAYRQAVHSRAPDRATGGSGGVSSSSAMP